MSDKDLKKVGQVFKKGSEVTMVFTFLEMVAAQDTGAFTGHREFVAWLFNRRGYIITNFADLTHKTFQDGPRESLHITHKVTGIIGKSLMKKDG